MKKRFLLVLAIALSFLILMIGHSAIAQRSTPAATTALAIQALAAQGAASPGNTEPANVLLIVTDPITATPITDLTQSNIAITNHFSPSGAKCGFSGEVRFFGGVGTGAYQIKLGLRTSVAGCTWVKGTYLGEIAVAFRGRFSQSAFALSIE